MILTYVSEQDYVLQTGGQRVHEENLRKLRQRFLLFDREYNAVVEKYYGLREHLVQQIYRRAPKILDSQLKRILHAVMFKWYQLVETLIKQRSQEDIEVFRKTIAD